MSQTKSSAIIASVFSWFVALIVPFTSWLYDSSLVKLLTVLIYPLIVSLLAREGFFWVRPEFIALSSVLTFLIGLALRANKKIKEALDKPAQNKQLAFWIFMLLIVIFLSILGGMGYARYLYNPSNF